ncbi:MAG: Gfo/Idh/MocA family oxidoreductase, partial [Bacteroidota bacterium]
MHRTDPVRWGIVGTGVIAAEFARVFPIVKSATLAAIASRDEVRAEAFAREHSAAWFHGSYEALFADPDIDAVYIATPHSHHATNTIAALRAGKAVLCEKPLTPTLTEAQAVVDVARQTGGYLAEGMWTYFLPAIQTARRWVADGRIGRVLRIHADFGYPQPYDPASRFYDPALAGGALLDMGVYPVALAWLFL